VLLSHAKDQLMGDFRPPFGHRAVAAERMRGHGRAGRGLNDVCGRNHAIFMAFYRIAVLNCVRRNLYAAHGGCMIFIGDRQ